MWIKLKNNSDYKLLQSIDSANEHESEDDTNIVSSGTGATTIQGEDGQQYVLLEMNQLGGQNQIDNASTNVSTEQDDNSSCKYKFKFNLNLILK